MVKTNKQIKTVDPQKQPICCWLFLINKKTYFYFYTSELWRWDVGLWLLSELSGQRGETPPMQARKCGYRSVSLCTGQEEGTPSSGRRVGVQCQRPPEALGSCWTEERALVSLHRSFKQTFIKPTPYKCFNAKSYKNDGDSLIWIKLEGQLLAIFHCHFGFLWKEEVICGE